MVEGEEERFHGAAECHVALVADRVHGAHGLRTDEESTQAAWVPPEDLDGYDIHPAILRRISHALHGTAPHVD